VIITRIYNAHLSRKKSVQGAFQTIGIVVCRLAKSIAGQIKERLNKSHEAFAAALKQLETRHSGRLDRIEEQRLKLRKVHAPRLAKLALESTSLRDIVLHGETEFSVSCIVRAQ
jgi:receptor-interacting serine/threonine-protein kinase 5